MTNPRWRITKQGRTWEVPVGRARAKVGSPLYSQSPFPTLIPRGYEMVRLTGTGRTGNSLEDISIKVRSQNDPGDELGITSSRLTPAAWEIMLQLLHESDTIDVVHGRVEGRRHGFLVASSAKRSLALTLHGTILVILATDKKVFPTLDMMEASVPVTWKLPDNGDD